MTQSSERDFLKRLAREHGLSDGAVKVVLDALRRGGGSMAQFSHAEFGGMSQWSSGMTMVGDMFNTALLAKLHAVATSLSQYLRDRGDDAKQEEPPVSYRSGRESSQRAWWPEEFASPSSVGDQNGMRYAVFPQSRRLVIEDDGHMLSYDTGDHQISGVSQAQSTGSTLTFVSQHGVVRVSELRQVDTRDVP